MLGKRRFFCALLFLGLLGRFDMKGLAEPVTIGGTNALDARRSLPIPWLLGKSYTDGFLLDHTTIPDLGVNIQTGGIYGYTPFGQETNRQFMVHRFMVPFSFHVFLFKWADVSLVLPFSLYQAGAGPNLYPVVKSTAVGDLSLGGKVRIPLPTKFVSLAASVRLGFDTASANSYLGAGQTSGGLNVVLQSAPFLGERLFLTSNIGFFIGGNSTPCLTNSAPMGTTSTMLTPPGCNAKALALGNHFTYGLGVSGLIWKWKDLPPTDEMKGLYVETEILGSISPSGEGVQTPFLWTAGLRSKLSDRFYGSLHYGIGGGANSPSHTVMAQLGFVWQSKKGGESSAEKAAEASAPSDSVQ